MIFCYIDESGVSQVPGNSTHFVLAGIAIPIHKWKQCEAEIQAVKKKYSIPMAEIHTGWMLRPYPEQFRIANFDKLDHTARRFEAEKNRNRELLRLQASKHTLKTYYQTKKNYEKTKPYIHLTFLERRQFIQDIARLIGGWVFFARLFAECIDKIYFNPAKALRPIDEQAFEQLVSRFEQYLQIYSKSSQTKQFGLLIHDNNPTVCKKHTALMKSFHQSGTLWTTVKSIIETPLFVDSELTSMVQLADVCAYSLRRYLEKGETSLFNEVIKIADKKDNVNVGVRHFSSQSCGCLICSSHKKP